MPFIIVDFHDTTITRCHFFLPVPSRKCFPPGGPTESPGTFFERMVPIFRIVNQTRVVCSFTPAFAVRRTPSVRLKNSRTVRKGRRVRGLRYFSRRFNRRSRTDRTLRPGVTTPAPHDATVHSIFPVSHVGNVEIRQQTRRTSVRVQSVSVRNTPTIRLIA